MFRSEKARTDSPKKFYLILLLVAVCFSFGLATPHLSHPASGRITITGCVYFDTNANSVRDKGEPGIPGIVVSDQIEVAVTNADGNYRMEGTGGFGIVFISIPNDWTARDSFWKKIETSSGQCIADFPLIQTGKIEEFAFLHASDPHLSKNVLPRLEKCKSIAESLKPSFILMTGDLLHDSLRVGEEEAKGYFELYKNEIGKFPVLVWNVPGNHELFGIERNLSHIIQDNPLYGKNMYRHYLGPDYYSFNYGGVHFIGLDSVDYKDTLYYGRIDETQLDWLKRDLSFVSPDTPVVTFCHIPFYSAVQTLRGFMDSVSSPNIIRIGETTYFRHLVSNALAALELFKGHNYTLGLAGHVHARECLLYELEGRSIRFHQAAAILGDVVYGGLRMASGVTLYRVKQGDIDDGEFIPLGNSQTEK
jgi:hypothetical protein